MGFCVGVMVEMKTVTIFNNSIKSIISQNGFNVLEVPAD
jgi:hypothetical protein